jgi:hypothetical protein
MNDVEKYSRAKQREARQLLSEARAARAGQPNQIQKVVSRLGGLLVHAGQWLMEWHVAPDRQPQGQVQ